MSAKEILITLGLVGAAAAAAPDPTPRVVTVSEERSQPLERATSPDALESSVHYAGCNEVRDLGKAPLYAGQPGYRIGMDGDRDGIACEPHRGR